MTIGRFFGLLLSAIIIAALGYGVSYWYPFPVSADTPPDRTPANELPEAPTRIEAQGRLEPATGTLAVGAFPGEQIVALNARVGMSVQTDDELAVLGSQKIREAEYQLALERMKIAEAQLKSELTTRTAPYRSRTTIRTTGRGPQKGDSSGRPGPSCRAAPGSGRGKAAEIGAVAQQPCHTGRHYRHGTGTATAPDQAD